MWHIFMIFSVPQWCMLKLIIGIHTMEYIAGLCGNNNGKDDDDDVTVDGINDHKVYVIFHFQ